MSIVSYVLTLQLPVSYAVLALFLAYVYWIIAYKFIGFTPREIGLLTGYDTQAHDDGSLHFVCFIFLHNDTFVVICCRCVQMYTLDHVHDTVPTANRKSILDNFLLTL